MPAAAIIEETSLAATAPADEIIILYATETGNAEYVAGDLFAALEQAGWAPTLTSMADISPQQLCGKRRLLIVASTYGDGEPPMQADAFFAALNAPDAPSLEGVDYGVLALGDRAYPTFCGFGNWLDARLAELGARRIMPITECDFDYSETAAAWIGSTLEELNQDAPRVSPLRVVPAIEQPAGAQEAMFEAPIANRLAMHSDPLGPLTVHLELSLPADAPRYAPGDSIAYVPRNDPEVVEQLLSAARCPADEAAHELLSSHYDICTLSKATVERFSTLGLPVRDDSIQDRRVADFLKAQGVSLTFGQLTSLLRPLAPRSYSIASSLHAQPDRLDLLVTRAFWPHGEGVRTGVASGDLVHRRATNEPLRWHHKPNRNFRLPDEADRPIVMVGAGTGIAPFRGFLQEREALGARGRNWLFFGHRNTASDFFYGEEIAAWRKTGLLTRLDCAFSRDQQAKIYVQHRLLDAGRELVGWLKDGAILYVCGALALGAAIDETLVRIFAAEGEDGTAALARMKQERTYLKDVY